MYYNMKEVKLLGDGLTLGYNTYINTRGGQTAKSTSMNTYTYINTTSLNQVICVFQDPDNWGTGAGLPKNLLLNTATADVSSSIAYINTEQNNT
jgi:hypothetical protein